MRKQEQQRVAVVDPGTHISFLFARCRPTWPRYAAVAAAAAMLLLLNADATALGSSLLKTNDY